MKIRDQGVRDEFQHSDFLWPRASQQGCELLGPASGSLPKGLMDIFISLNGSEGMGKVADTARPDSLSYLLRN